MLQKFDFFFLFGLFYLESSGSPSQAREPAHNSTIFSYKGYLSDTLVEVGAKARKTRILSQVPVSEYIIQL